MSGATVEFRFESTADEERFLREYLTDAWPRFETSGWWEAGWFWAYRQFAGYESGPDGGLVRIVFDGSPDDLVAAEADRWDAFDGLDSWDLRRYEETEEGYGSLLEQQRDAKGAVGGEREYRLKVLTARFALDYYREFDEQVPPVGGGRGGHGPSADVAEDGEESEDSEHGEFGKHDEANPAKIGIWAALHDLLVQTGYDWYDETEVCLQAMRNRTKSLAAYRGAEAAREEYDRIAAEWDAYGSELDGWLAEHPTGGASEP